MSEVDDCKAAKGQLLIELASAADYERIGDLTVEAYLQAGHFDDPQHEYLHFVRQVAQRGAHCDIFVARKDGQIIASMTLIQAGNEYADVALEGELEIRMLSVDPTVQRAGAGRAMVLAAIELARQLPEVHAVSLTTGGHWSAARRLYESLGFTHRPERDWVVPDTDIRLVVYALVLES
ncbi:GNAT family N-acetyltransferase [Glutamicibacter sp. 287]|uniref:GNAT family N-acetyltransferase n=1 Tax=unclassified Glutamicibacter TaxID=2627139 RepID=UPI000BB8ADC3|nr:GNAT family N-acetyltransferase [Glutamicibacter sp. BW80]PCC27990.1 GNAT family N-acetyltransferase [Glutamicibacter sp. BW80]